MAVGNGKHISKWLTQGVLGTVVPEVVDSAAPLLNQGFPPAHLCLLVPTSTDIGFLSWAVSHRALR